MAYRYAVRGNVANGTYETEVNSLEYSTGTFIIAFYDGSGNPVTPTAGTVKPEMSPTNGQWHSPSAGDSTIDATKCIAGVATYVIPTFTGPSIKGRVILAGVTGASTFEAFFWRSN
jgi:hypothetical protein